MPRPPRHCRRQQELREAKPGLANLPIEKIDEVGETDRRAGRRPQELQDATGKAVSLLQAACPDDTPLTPPGRLAAMENVCKR